MKFRAAACVALALMAGAPAMAQNAQPKPATAPGVQVERINKLMVGDRAPELAIAEWVKGDEVTGFEDGKVYVVEFWATWCGPCIRGMPHLSELQEEYKEKGVTIVGVNIWDEPGNVAPFMKDKGGDEKMGYTVAVEKKIEGEDPRRTGEMAANWMRAAGRNGIPSAFIVDQRGYIAWMGHPMQMDEALKGVVAGSWDIKQAAKDHAAAVQREAEQRAQQEVLDKFMDPVAEALQKKDYTAASKLMAAAIENEAIWGNPQALNSMAWSISDPDAKIENRDAKLAVKMAERASELAKGKDAAILDTLAWAYYHAGDKAKAIETETKALGMVSGEEKAQYEAALKRMSE
jgi:thiol-disulfide isomerase/thioredoxin